MKKRISTVIFFALFYLTASYSMAYIAFACDDYYDNYEPETNFQKVNVILIWFAWLFYLLAAFLLFFVGCIVPLGLLNIIKLKRKRYYQ